VPVWVFILCLAAKNEPRKRAKGLAPWIPLQREKVAALSLCSSFRDSKQIQPLRLQVKKLANAEVIREQKSKKFLLSATHPCQHKFQTKTR